MVQQPRPLIVLMAALLVCAFAVGPMPRPAKRVSDSRAAAAPKPQNAGLPRKVNPRRAPAETRAPSSRWLRDRQGMRADPSAGAPPRRPPRTRPALPLRSFTGGPGVALTFDDGPHPDWTPRILAQLRKYKVKATFCLVGVQVRAHPELVRQIVADGHSLCNHTMSHDIFLRKKPRAQIVADLAQTNALIEQVSGVRPRHFRAPGGNWSAQVTSVASALGMASLHWDVDPQDWRRPLARHIVSSVKNNTRPGSIVLLHDAGGERTQTDTALRTLLPYLRGQFKLVAL
jgi:peptidoglycan/xylan/chitin deacetylase (PgdA/CDA1 family)